MARRKFVNPAIRALRGLFYYLTLRAGKKKIIE
jgi:hypothetical protein